MNKILTLVAAMVCPLLMHAQRLDQAAAERLAETEVNKARAAHLAKAAAGWKEKTIRHGDKVLRFETKTFGQAAPGQKSLYISLHGGGNTTPAANDQQWENQKKLYTPAEGLYFVPRAATNTWNLWHEEHIDALFDEVIKTAVAQEGVDPNRVYLLGYSAGGDGLYQLAPRMADRLAAASMMAGHPGDASALPLRNLPFAIFMGANDGAYDRNKHAARWGSMLDSLQATDPRGYVHKVEIYPGLGHWMNRKDTVAISWMARFTRQPLPEQVIWVQDDRVHQQFYWLGTGTSTKAGDRVVAAINRASNEINLTQNTFEMLEIYLNDGLVDLDKPVTLRLNGKKIFKGKLNRSAAIIRSTAARRLDKAHVFSAGLQLSAGKVSVL